MTSSERVVLRGSAGDLTWEVVVQGDIEHLETMLYVRRGEVSVLKAGFSGPGLYPGALMNEWRGREEGTPHFVMARTKLDVHRVIAQTDRGLNVELATEADSVAFGLRFYAAVLPEGHAPGRLHAYMAGKGRADDVVTPTPR